MVLPVMVFGFVTDDADGDLLSAHRADAPARHTRRHTGGDRQFAAAAASAGLALVGVAIQQSSHAMLYAFSSIYWHHLGFSGTEVGILWSAGVAAEVMVFFISKHLNRRFSAWTLIRSAARFASAAGSFSR